MVLCQKCWKRFDGDYSETLCKICREQKTLDAYTQQTHNPRHVKTNPQNGNPVTKR